MKVLALSMVVFLNIFQTAFSDTDCPRMYQGIKGHTACMAPSDYYISGGVSKEDIKVILEEHNKVRARVKPPSCTMFKLYWYDELAYVAQSWAKQCDFNHDKKRSIPGSFLAGQNLAKGFSSWKAAIKGWSDEVKDFTYSVSNQLEKVGHYTQMVAEDSTMVGCGYAKCKGDFRLFVCNYGPSGNIGSAGTNTPWKKCGKAAPLIDCKGKFCKNQGFMKDGTCECKCENWKHIIGPDCSTNCSVKDTFPCGEAFSKDTCHYNNVPPQCPWTCNTCPYLDGKKSGAAALKYTVISVLPLIVLFIANCLLQ